MIFKCCVYNWLSVRIDTNYLTYKSRHRMNFSPFGQARIFLGPHTKSDHPLRPGPSNFSALGRNQIWASILTEISLNWKIYKLFQITLMNIWKVENIERIDHHARGWHSLDILPTLRTNGFGRFQHFSSV